MVTKQAPDPYGFTEYRGRPMLNIDKAAVMLMESKLGYALTVVQAIGDAPASAGYHAQGRMLDLAYWDAENKNRVAKDCGLASWIRDDRDNMVEHLHQAVIFAQRGNKRGISSGGLAQIGSFDRGMNGLAVERKDRDAYRPSPKKMITHEQYEFIITGGLTLPEPNAVTRMRDGMVETLHELSLSIREGKDVEGRPVVEATVEDLKKYRREIRDRLEKMPKR